MPKEMKVVVVLLVVFESTIEKIFSLKGNSQEFETFSD